MVKKQKAKVVKKKGNKRNQVKMLVIGLPLMVLTGFAFMSGVPTTASIISTDTTTEQKFLIGGDVNDDGIVNIVDSLLIVQSTVKLRQLTSPQLDSADVNKDGKVDITDALYIAQYTVGLRQLKQYSFLLGDVNLDGIVDKNDIDIGVTYLSNFKGFSGYQIFVLDMDENRRIEEKDIEILTVIVENKQFKIAKIGDFYGEEIEEGLIISDEIKDKIGIFSIKKTIKNSNEKFFYPFKKIHLHDEYWIFNDSSFNKFSIPSNRFPNMPDFTSIISKHPEISLWIYVNNHTETFFAGNTLPIFINYRIFLDKTRQTSWEYTHEIGHSFNIKGDNDPFKDNLCSREIEQFVNQQTVMDSAIDSIEKYPEYGLALDELYFITTEPFQELTNITFQHKYYGCDESQ